MHPSTTVKEGDPDINIAIAKSSCLTVIAIWGFCW